MDLYSLPTYHTPLERRCLDILEAGINIIGKDDRVNIQSIAHQMY
jgi:hypothetical protein